MSIYTKTSENIYLLNDKNIASSMDDTSVLSNAIPSFDIVSAAYDEFEELCGDVNLSIGNLCIRLSTDIKNLSDTVDADYVHSAGDSVNGSLSIAQLLTVDNNVQFKRNLNVSNNLTQGKGSFVSNAIDRGIAMGISAVADLNDAFVWNGDDTATTYSVQDSKPGSFNVNPRGGASGLYVGAQNLCTIVSTNVLLSVSNLSILISAASALISNWVDVRRTNDKDELSNTLSSYADSLCASLSGEVDRHRTSDKVELSNTLSNYADSISATANATYAKYNDFSFEYNENSHYLSVTLKNVNGSTSCKAVDATAFIKNRIIHHMDVKQDEGVLRIFWENAAGSEDHADIKLSSIAKVYSAGEGITIADNLTLSVNRYNELTACLILTSANVDTLSNTSIPTLTGKVDSLETYVKHLSALKTDGGIIATLSVDLHDLSNNISTDVYLLSNKYVATSSNVDALLQYANLLSSTTGGDIPYISGRIDALRTEIRGAANFCGQVSMNKYLPDWVHGADTSISAFFKYAVNRGTENAIKNGNIYEIVFQEREDIDPYMYVMSNPVYAADLYFDTSDGVRLAHNSFIAVTRPDGSVEIPLTEINNKTVRVIAGDWYKLYQISVQNDIATSWRDGGNKLDTVISVGIETVGSLPRVIVRTGHAISGDNDIGGSNHFLDGGNVFDGVNSIEQLSSNLLSADSLSAFSLTANTLSANSLTANSLSAASLTVDWSLMYNADNSTLNSLSTAVNNIRAQLKSIYNKINTIELTSDLSAIISAVVEIKNGLQLVS